MDFWKLPGLGVSNINFLIADVTSFVFDTVITFSQGDLTKIKSEQFSEIVREPNTFLRSVAPPCEKVIFPF